MLRRFFIASLLTLGYIGLARGQEAPQPVESKHADYTKEIAPLLGKYCVTCHGGMKPKGDLSLEFKTQPDLEKQLLKDRSMFERMAKHVSFGDMPPATRPQPTANEKAQILTWINRDILTVDCGGQRDPGRVTVRRLNKVEYTNTIRDLLYVKNFKASADFPADDSGYGFDNNGDVLTMSPLLLEQYLKVAEEAVRLSAKDAQASAKLRDPAKNLKEGFYNKQEVARLMLETFLPRAYRRPVTTEEIDRMMNFVRLSLAQDGESAQRGVQLAMRAALMSPNFLFRIEPDTGPDSNNGSRKLNEYELANRLSYFLWSSMPDDELFAQAKKQTLRTNLEAQVKRMLADPKTRALTDNFAGQWLELRGLSQFKPDATLFPEFDDSLRQAMIGETNHYFDYIVHEDRSILEFLDSDYTFVNERLAKHYGIEGVQGSNFQKVAIDPEKRGGLITQASILTITSRTNRTSPVIRGKWILENILNTPPPPPPPDVPALENDGKQLTGSLRQILEKHRADVQCSVCHEKLDPLGLALENYNVLGIWRTHEGDTLIDPSGTLPGGQMVKGPRDLRSILKGRDGDFRRCLTEKMLTYALGRGLEYYDKCAVDEMCAAVARDDNRFSSVIMSIVRSDPFQYRRSSGAK